ncbi:MAG: hypothetical protein HYT62_02185 [Candidatus Yanofskybacteria bacterium]|nr:hypothetical protein [Candidatus Yanofskybacteria bacterium]
MPKGYLWQVLCFMEKIKTILQWNDRNKLIIMLAVLLLPAVYYFGYFLPRQKEEARIFSMQQKCREVGEKLYKADLDNYDLLSESVGGPEYYYSKQLNTCLYYNRISYTTVLNSSVRSFVKDSFTNKVLLLWHWKRFNEDREVVACDVCVSTEEEFHVRKEILFSQ